MNCLCATHGKKLRQAGTWDLEPFAVELAPGQTSPQITKYKETTSDSKYLCDCAVGAISGQKIQKDQKLQLPILKSQ